MKDKTCKDCRHFVLNDYIGCCTLRCDVTCDDDSACTHFAELTVFDKITESPEVLVEKLVYCLDSSSFRVIDSAGRLLAYENEGWASTILPGSFWTEYEEAFSATLEKLKEVCDA